MTSADRRRPRRDNVDVQVLAALAFTAAASVGMTVLTAVPAEAFAIPAWPVGGYVPTGCTITTSAPHGSGLFTISHSDPLEPTITDVLVNGGTAVALKPGAATSYTVSIKAGETCSGVGYLAVAWVRAQTHTYQPR